MVFEKKVRNGKTFASALFVLSVPPSLPPSPSSSPDTLRNNQRSPTPLFWLEGPPTLPPSLPPSLPPFLLGAKEGGECRCSGRGAGGRERGSASRRSGNLGGGHCLEENTRGREGGRGGREGQCFAYPPSLLPFLLPCPTFPAFSRTTSDEDQKVHVRVKARESDKPSLPSFPASILPSPCPHSPALLLRTTRTSTCVSKPGNQTSPRRRGRGGARC